MTVLTIEAFGARGDGVAAGHFVPFTLAGEKVRAAGEGQRLMLSEIIVASAERVAAPCPHFTDCGGCALQHWAMEPYLAWKRDLVAQALKQAGLAADLRPIIDAHGGGRRRATFHARKGADGRYRLGFNAARDHRVVPLDACLLLSPAMAEALPFARLLTERLSGSGAPLDYQITSTLNGLDIDVRGLPAAKRPSDKTLIAVMDRPGLARLTLGGQLVFQRQLPLVDVAGQQVLLPPAAFLQATELGQDTLTRLVIEATGPKPGAMLDLFCGVGTFTFALSRLGKVHGVDANADGVKALFDCARFMQGIKPLTVEARDLFRRPYLPMDLKHYQTVVFDPPRAGAEAQVKQIAKSKISRVVAVSCNLASFIQDVKALVEAGFKLNHVTPVDQFRWSSHVELVALLQR